MHCFFKKQCGKFDVGPELRRKVVFLGEKNMIFQRELLNFRGDDGSLNLRWLFFQKNKSQQNLLNVFSVLSNQIQHFFENFNKKTRRSHHPPGTMIYGIFEVTLRCCEHLFSPAPLHGVYPMQARPRRREAETRSPSWDDENHPWYPGIWWDNRLKLENLSDDFFWQKISGSIPSSASNFNLFCVAYIKT